VLSDALIVFKQTVPPQQKRMADDAERRLNALFDALNCETLSTPVVDCLIKLANAMSAKDSVTASQEHVAMMTRASPTDDIAVWMPGVKLLVSRMM